MRFLSNRKGQTVATLASVVLTIVLLAIWPGARAVLAVMPLQVTVTATATDPNGSPLTYRWRSSDGQISNVNSATTTWTLPDGPGVHFAYVLVSNGKGGYTEQRVAVNTDRIGNPLGPNPSPRTLQPPRSPLPVGETYRRFTFKPDVLFFAEADDNSLRVPASGYLKSDTKSQMIFRGMLPVFTPPVTMNIWCADPQGGAFEPCETISPDESQPPAVPPETSLPPEVAVSDTHFRPEPSHPAGTDQLTGKVLLADGGLCGTQNAFFGVEVTPRVEIRNQANAIAAGPVRASIYGWYDISYPSGLINPSLVIRCESATYQLPVSGWQEELAIPGTALPVVSQMTATLNSVVVGRFTRPVNPPALPSDNVRETDKFLGYKGVDTRISGCLYYKAVGAATGCDRAGNMIGPVRFDDWKRTVQIGPYVPPGGPTEFAATYINKADLNLTRNHHSISYGPNHTAAYVCNHLGPNSLDPDQTEINRVVDDAVHGRNLVACVAMDYMSAPGVNHGLPFVRFLIFGPSGDLLPSVNLDGRREKFVPGTCVVCHGGDHYTARYQEAGITPANVGAHFLPYDIGNFFFSDQPGLTRADQEAQIRNLNVNVLKAGPTVAADELIKGWYNQDLVNGTFHEDYLPPSWAAVGDPLATEFYHKVVATSCRGCHVNMDEGFNWDHYANLNSTAYRSTDLDAFYASIGDCNPANPQHRMHSMPNSAVTFNRFWNTQGTGPGNDLPALFDTFLATYLFSGLDPSDVTCQPTRP